MVDWCAHRCLMAQTNPGQYICCSTVQASANIVNNCPGSLVTNGNQCRVNPFRALDLCSAGFTCLPNGYIRYIHTYMSLHPCHIMLCSLQRRSCTIGTMLSNSTSTLCGHCTLSTNDHWWHEHGSHLWWSLCLVRCWLRMQTVRCAWRVRVLFCRC